MTINELFNTVSGEIQTYFLLIVMWLYDLSCKLGAAKGCSYHDWKELTIGQVALVAFIFYSIVAGGYEQVRLAYEKTTIGEVAGFLAGIATAALEIDFADHATAKLTEAVPIFAKLMGAVPFFLWLFACILFPVIVGFFTSAIIDHNTKIENRIPNPQNAGKPFIAQSSQSVSAAGSNWVFANLILAVSAGLAGIIFWMQRAFAGEYDGYFVPLGFVCLLLALITVRSFSRAWGK